MKVGFVCTNYNNSSFTRAAVESLYANQPGGDVRIVVVDNKSEAADLEKLADIERTFPEIRLVRNQDNIGYFPGLNIGIRLLRTTWPEIDHVVIGNNDLVFPPNFVQTVQRFRDVFDTWAVVAPDIVTPAGVHQNPHVLHPISRMRKLVWELFYSSYAAAGVIKRVALAARRLTARAEQLPENEIFKRPSPIEMGFGACYILGPRFFQAFDALCAPTFLMEEEFFLTEQVKSIGQRVYYDPRFVVQHHDHATTDLRPSRRYWETLRDGHRVYKRYLALSVAERREFVLAATRRSS